MSALSDAISAKEKQLLRSRSKENNRNPNEEAISVRTGQNMALLGTTLAGRPRALR